MSSRTDPLAPAETRALINVVVDLADDLGFVAAIAVLDVDGSLRAVERPPEIPARVLRAAIECARMALRGRPQVADGTIAALPLGGRGAIAVGGGPGGFASEACRSAAQALTAADRPAPD